MGLRDWARRMASNQPDRYPPVNYGGMSFSGRVDSAGRPVVQLSAEDAQILRLAGGLASYADIYRTQWAVRTCVNFLALNIAHLKLKSYRRTDESPELLRSGEHPLPTLLERPNARTTGFDLILGTVSDLAVYDNAYWWKAFQGNARSLFRIPPAFVQPKGGSILTGPAEYWFDTGSGPVARDPETIIHFKGYNALDPRLGSSRLEALKTILAEEIAASKHRAGFWKNAARRDGVVERPLDAPAWSDMARKRWREDWRAAHTGGDNAGNTAVLEEGMKWNGDSFSPREAEFVAGREFSLDTVATAYQIPLALLSRKNTATFASMREFHKMLYVDVLGPWNALIERTIWLQLIPEFNDPDLYVEFNIDEKLQGDFETQAQALRQAVQVPFMSVNDARALRNLKRIDDPKFDQPATPANYNYGGAPVAQAAPGLRRAAGNGHGDVEAEQIAQLEMLLEEP